MECEGSVGVASGAPAGADGTAVPAPVFGLPADDRPTSTARPPKTTTAPAVASAMIRPARLFLGGMGAGPYGCQDAGPPGGTPPPGIGPPWCGAGPYGCDGVPHPGPGRSGPPPCPLVM